MRIHYLAVAISLILKYFSLVMLFPVGAALYFKDTNSLIAFTITMFVAFVIGFVLNPKKIDANLLNDLKKSEALATVSLSWVSLS